MYTVEREPVHGTSTREVGRIFEGEKSDADCCSFVCYHIHYVHVYTIYSGPCNLPPLNYEILRLP